MIVIKFESRGKTYSKIEEIWFLLVHRVPQNIKINEKIQKQLSESVI